MGSQCLVSIITCCYNGEKFINQYMESVLQQTYSNIELILVNDGSTDSSEEKILSYKNKLQERGICFEYVYKENGGHSSAINAGLKRYHGKYLTWPDIDDVMHADYIETKTAYMESHPEVDYLITPSAVINIDNPTVVIYYTWKKAPKSKEDMLRRIICGKNYFYEAGSFFISSKILEKANPMKKIYDACGKWAGPQIQMMLPIIYYGNSGYLDKCLFNYYLHSENDHNKYKTKEDLKIKYSESYKMIIHTIESVEMIPKEEAQYKNMAFCRIKREELNAAFQLHDEKWYTDLLKEWGKNASFKDKFKLLALKYFIFKILYKTAKSILKKGD